LKPVTPEKGDRDEHLSAKRLGISHKQDQQWQKLGAVPQRRHCRRQAARMTQEALELLVAIMRDPTAPMLLRGAAAAAIYDLAYFRTDARNRTGHDN